METSEAKRLSWIAALSIAFALCCLSVLLAFLIVGEGEQRYLSNVVKLPCLPSQDVQVLGEGVVYADGAYLRALNASGAQIWSYAAGSGSAFRAGEDGVAVWSGATLTLLDARTGAPTFSRGMGSTVLDATVGQAYAAAHIGEESDGELVILDHSGAQVDRIGLQSQTVLDYGFFNSGAMLWIMSLDTEGTAPMSSITTYKPGKTQTGTISDTEQIVYRVLFQSSRVVSVGTVYAKAYNYTGIENSAQRKLVYGWYLSSYAGTGDGLIMAYVPMSQSEAFETIREVRMIGTDLDRTVRLPFGGFAVAACDRKIYGFAPRYVMACGPDDAKATTYELPAEVSDFRGITTKRAALLASEEAMYLVSLP